MRQVRLTSWQPFPYDQRHPFLGASRSHRVTTDQLRSAREQTPALFGHEFVGYGSLRELHPQERAKQARVLRLVPAAHRQQSRQWRRAA